MRLTIAHVRRAPQFTNTMLQREIDLRGLCISSLDESVLALLDNSFDVVNLTSNALSCLEYFPVAASAAQKTVKMDRVTSLIAHRNHIQRVSIASCVLALPNVEHFLADRNSFRAVRDLYFLKFWKKLLVVSIEGNPLCDRNPENYDAAQLRAFLVFLCPTLKLINYQRVTQADRELAQANKSSFAALVSSIESSTADSAVEGAGGRRIRKRGREQRQAAGSTAGDGAAPRANEEADVAAGVDAAVSDASLQARLEEIENRINDENATPEDIIALEQEILDITAEMERAKKRRL